MNLGSVLIRPQRLERSVIAARGVDTDASIIEDLLVLVSRLILDPTRAEPVLKALGEAITPSADRLQAHITARFEVAAAHMRDWMLTLLDSLPKLQPPQDEFDVEEALSQVKQLLEQLAGLAETLTVNGIHQQLQPVMDIVQNDLEITPDFIEQEIWWILDGVIESLDNVPETASAEEKYDRRDLAAVLRRVKRRFRGTFQFPALDVEPLARELIAFLKRTCIEEVIRQVACSLDHVGQGVNSLDALRRIVGSELEGAVSVGAAAANDYRDNNAGDFSWYATWLLARKYDDIPLFKPGDLKNAAGLVQRLKAGGDAHSAYIFNSLSEEQKNILSSHTGDEEPEESVILVLLDGLNALVRGSPLYYEDEFEHVEFNEETRDISQDYREDQTLMRFNRYVLEDAYPELLDTISRNNWAEDIFGFWTGGWWVNVGRALLGLIDWPGEQVRVDAEGKRVLLGGKILHTGENVTWDQAPIFSYGGAGDFYYLFQRDWLNPNVMEWTAFITALLHDAGTAVWHMIQMQPGHRIPSIFNGVYDIAHCLNAGIAGKSFSGYRDTPFYRWHDFFLELTEARGGLPFLSLFATSWQGKHSDASGRNIAAFWFTVFMGDIIKYIGPLSTLSMVRNSLLSIMTLLNFPASWGGGPSTLPRDPAQNHQEQDDIVSLVETLFTMWLVSYVDREDYTHPFHPGDVPGDVWKLWLLGGWGMGLFAGLVGSIMAQILAWAEDWERFGLTLLKKLCLPKIWLLFWPLLYSRLEGDTDEGRFNPGGTRFLGYPARPSPYLLPYDSGQAINVGQANAGIWSHNPPANQGATLQTYAVDFALDQAQEVLASRPGTVQNFFDNTVDDTTGPWNFISIRHDLDNGGNPIPPDPDHDLDGGGTVRRTYAEYGHGRQNGVTDVFTARPNSAGWPLPPGGKPPNADTIGISGGQVVWLDTTGNPINDPATGNFAPVTVVRGQPIMLAGDTGTSWYNHLHMHVLPEQAGISAPNTAHTIPFVFDDVDNEGVCKALKWYESSNTRVP